MESLISEFEARLGCRLPEDYRAFLLKEQEPEASRVYSFQKPKSGIIDHLLTIEEIIENDLAGRIGIPEESLLHIGGNIMSGYLYLKVSDAGFGEIHYSENYQMKESFLSFSEFLQETVQSDS